jgi:hypothetical protein
MERPYKGRMDDSLNPFAREAAREAIIAKRDRLLALRIDLMERRRDLLVQLRRADRELADCRAAARLFDLEIEFPDEEERVLSSAEREARARVEATRREIESRLAYSTRMAVPAPVAQIVDVGSLPVAFSSGEVIASPKAPRPAIKDVVLEQLREAVPAGRKAAELREYIERTYGESIHEKTVGMTLYRLSRDKLVRREGHTWFFGSAPAETENPGDEAPGSDSLFQ